MKPKSYGAPWGPKTRVITAGFLLMALTVAVATWFSMHGRFRSKRLGKFRAFVTDPANSVDGSARFGRGR